MKKFNYVLFALLFTFLNISVIKAKCESEEIVKKADGIKVTLNAVPPTKEVGDKSFVNVENIPENYYIIAVNNTTATKAEYREFEKGKLTFTTPQINIVYNYSIKIYSSATECENELIKTLKTDSLAYNPLSISPECAALKEDKNNNTFEGCNTYINKVYTYKEFMEELDTYKVEEPEEVLTTLSDLFYKYYYFALIPIALLGLYYAIRLQIIKRRKNKDE